MIIFLAGLQNIPNELIEARPDRWRKQLGHRPIYHFASDVTRDLPPTHPGFDWSFPTINLSVFDRLRQLFGRYLNSAARRVSLHGQHIFGNSVEFNAMPMGQPCYGCSLSAS